MDKKICRQCLEEKPLTSEQCVRCGVHLTEDRKGVVSLLWCKKCRERVDEELRGEISRPYQYYFRWHLRHKK